MLPIRSIVAASRNDPLARYERISGFARSWGSKLVDLGEVGHLNPASGYGDWLAGDGFIAELAADGSHRLPEIPREHRRTMLMS
jgi:hypothetical protein